MPDFLLEIGCEEIPARMINDAEMTLQARVANLFGRAGLWPQDEIDPSKIETLSTPRRLAVIIRDALHAQPDKAEQVMGPPLKVAQKDGQPTAAGEAFSKKVGVPWNQLKIVISAKGEYLAAEITKKGRTALEILAERLPCEIDNIHCPKSMYWRDRVVRAVRALPEEVRVTVARDHQRYFAVEESNHERLPHFLAVLNTASDPQSIMRHGHERVLRARFNGARFFWQTDQKHSLRERVDKLKHVTFQKDLGSYYDKTMRVQRLASWLCEVLRHVGVTVRPGVVHKAACLAKADLTTELVKEFTELQGIVGGLYARAQQLDSDLPEATRFAIADAIYNHYKPESMNDFVPPSVEGAVLAIAD